MRTGAPPCRVAWKEASPSMIGLMQYINPSHSHNVTTGFLGCLYLNLCPWIVARNFGDVQVSCTFLSLHCLAKFLKIECETK